MVLPLIAWGVVAVGGALVVGGGGYAAGREIGKGISKSLPLVAGSLLVYTLYQAQKK